MSQGLVQGRLGSDVLRHVSRNRDTVTEIVCRIMCTCMRLYFVYGHARSMHMSPITGGVVAEGELAYSALARNEYR